ncbi:MAG TPA: peptidoglycan DD-metalloendopeptidase family protein [Acidimicrobiales bacterium]|jgi:triacylglycerol esterase/lipase EstA (alpha/beta hydrolase family)|nr:peptidoglycan DD-metalloendopeptidase family protein [Acidimicrobiales bacterium]
MRRLAVVLAILVALVPAAPALAAAAAGPSTVTYRPPVDAPVVDAFRPPPEDWDPGNRGLEYATSPGTPVAASAAGEVVFAGQVGGALHVVVLHDDGIRTSYSFLATISVHRGDKVRQGQQLGTTADRFHFGARAGDAYLDPAKLFGDGPPEVHLVPDEVRKPGTEAQERAGLLGLVKTFGAWVASNGADAVDWVHDGVSAQIADKLDELRGAIHYANELRPSTHLVRFLQALHEWEQARATCTPTSVPTPRLQERHLAVLVGGLGSSSKEAAVDDVNTAALGYAKADVVRYSYNGGTTAETPYQPGDTTVDIHESARRLRELLERLQAEHPGVPVDIIAHSQGGIVARTALTDEVDGADPRLPGVASLVMLGSPNQGAPGATLLTMFGHTTTGEVIEAAVPAVLPNAIDPAATSIAQMAEESEFMRKLNSRPLPDGLHTTSIGAREDLIVPAGVTHLDGANNVIVSVPGHLNEHGDLPGSAQAQREIALAVTGMTPTCQSLADALADAGVSDVIRGGEEAAGAAAWAAGRWADAQVAAALPSPQVPTRYES